jgi:hypothetical protein
MTNRNGSTDGSAVTGVTLRIERHVLNRILAVIIAAVSLASPATRSYGAPMTFAFDAEVTSIVVATSTGFGFPFEVSIGDNIAGRFTFEPAPLGRIGPQDLGIEFRIADLMLHSPTYEIVIGLNLFPPFGSEDFEPSDVITVACSLLSTRPQCMPGTVPGAAGIEWRPFMQLSGPSPILSNHDLIGDSEIWNSFTGRSLELDFFTPGIGGGFVGAIVGQVRSIPEPATCRTIVVLALTFAIVGRDWR